MTSPPRCGVTLNLVERWFPELSRKCIRRGSFLKVKELIRAIQEFLDTYNENPNRFVWTTCADAVLKKVSRCKAVPETLH